MGVYDRQVVRRLGYRSLGDRVWCVGFGVGRVGSWVKGFRVLVYTFLVFRVGVQDFRFRFSIRGSGFSVEGSGCRVQDVGVRGLGGWMFRVQGSGFRVHRLRFRVQRLVSGVQ